MLSLYFRQNAARCAHQIAVARTHDRYCPSASFHREVDAEEQVAVLWFCDFVKRVPHHIIRPYAHESLSTLSFS